MSQGARAIAQLEFRMQVPFRCRRWQVSGHGRRLASIMLADGWRTGRVSAGRRTPSAVALPRLEGE